LSYNTKSVCVVDLGLFTELAAKLVKDFGKVYYYFPWRSSPFPRSNPRLVGKGIRGLTLVEYFWDIVPEVDLFVFPDIFMGDIQQELVRQGKRVWGSRRGDELELYRPESKEIFEDLGLPVGPYEVVKGLDNLRTYLKENPNQFVKCSVNRGDFETFESKEYKLVEPKIDELEHKLGAKKYIIEFVVEADIPGVEIAYDGFCIDGKFPEVSLSGIETKNKGYLGRMIDYDKLPEELTHFNTVLSPLLKRYQYRNFYSPEMRITKDKTAYMIDLCARCGSPPMELLLEVYENLSDILWQGADGVVVNPKAKFPWGAQIMLDSAWADSNWQPISFPKKLRNNVKLRNLAYMNGSYYVIPQSFGCSQIGAVVAGGNTKEEAIEKCKEYTSQVTGYYLESFPESLDCADEEIAKLNSFGVKF